MKSYYENKLANQNYVAKPNVAWAADITHLKITEDKIIEVFLCIDLYSNIIVVSIFRTRVITSKEIVRKLNEIVKKRIPIKPRKRLIIHTDRGTQFTSKVYNQFLIDNKNYIEPSMSKANQPIDNSVAERFMRTFKNRKINGRTFYEELINQKKANPHFKSYRKIFNLYTKNLNSKPNRKSKKKSPKQYDLQSSTAAIFMKEPLYSKSFSKQIGYDHRQMHIDQFKNANQKVINIIEEITAKRSEVVDSTPFDFNIYDHNLLIQAIDQRFNRVLEVIYKNPEVTREYVEECLLPIQDTLDSMDDKLNALLPKNREKREKLPLRDPVSTELFDLFKASAASKAKYKKDLKYAQLLITYTILFYTGLRINEIRCFQEKDIENAIQTSQFSVIHHKQKDPYIHIISEKAVQELKGLKNQMNILFIKYKYKYLFGKTKPIGQKHLIAMVNKDLKNICETNNIPYNIKSHSFRVHMISKLLKETSVQNTADIIGHRDIKSTIMYKRYALNKKEIISLLNKIE